MSLTSRERHNPPPRQKSCAACIKAKRRCDAGTPSCMRCAQRGIPCELPLASAARRKTARERTMTSPTAAGAAEAAAAATVPTPALSTVDFMSDLSGGVPTLESTCSPHFGNIPFPESDPLYAFMDSCTSTLPQETEASAPPSTFWGESGVADMPAGELVYQASAVAPPTRGRLAAISKVVHKRLRYAVDEIKKAPRVFVETNGTPWSHVKLYEDEMPKSIRDAHACCALYMAKNEVNAPVIMSSIESYVDSLLAGPEPTTTVERLAHTQSLILYHIIRLFDGDLAARASGERTQAALEDSAMALVAHVDFQTQLAEEDLPLYPLGRTRASYRGWVVHESARRTLLLTFFMLQAYRVMSGQPVAACDGRLGLCHSFTLSARLWAAPGPVEFALAWRERHHLVVELGDFDAMFADARPEDLDVFGKILLTSMIGVDEAEGWLVSKGGTLGSFVP